MGGDYAEGFTLFEGSGARGTRTLTALQPEDFKSSTSTISSSPHAILHDDSTTPEHIRQPVWPSIFQSH